MGGSHWVLGGDKLRGYLGCYPAPQPAESRVPGWVGNRVDRETNAYHEEVGTKLTRSC